jgi:hypothetical protein
MRNPLFYHFRILILASKINQKIMFLKPFLGRPFSHFCSDVFQKRSIWGPPSKSDGVKNGTKINQVAPQISSF